MINSTMNTQYIAEANNGEATAQIAIYPISLMGLDASGFGAEAAGMTSSKQLFTARVAMHEMLNNLADTTGGRARSTEPMISRVRCGAALRTGRITTHWRMSRKIKSGMARCARFQ